MKFNLSARGLILENNKVLFVEYEINGGNYFALPGGSVEVGETLSNCVVREFMEETQIFVEPQKLILVNEFINEKPNYVAESWKNGIHQVEAIFLLKRNSNTYPEKFKTKIDFGMKGLKWMSKVDLAKVKYYPEKEIDWFFKNHENENLYCSKVY